MIVEVVLLVILVVLVWKSVRKPPGLPPGRWGLPLVGYIPLTTKSMEEQVMDLHKQHGSVVMWRIGTQPLIFINDYKLAKDAYNRLEFTDRPDWEAFKILDDMGYGVASSNGALWHNNRRFTLRELRDLGMGKSKIVDKIQEQGVALREAIARRAGPIPTEIPGQVFVSLINVIWHMVAGVQFEAEDRRCKEFIQLMTDIPLNLNYVTLKDLMPWLSRVMPDSVFKWLIKYHETLAMREKFTEYFYEEIEKHRATLDADNPRDLIDAYLLSMQVSKDDPETGDHNLSWILLNMFFAGTDTTAITFKWLCCYLAAHPDVQDKLHQEIDTHLPNDAALPSLIDRSSMAYTEAVINEVMRMSSLINFGVQHVASTDTQLGGYTIPKGAVLNTTAFSIQYDERYWDQPCEFRPERWLDQDGKFNVKKDGYLPFGVGKRLCVGESLARMELFIFTSIVFQRFRVAPPPGTAISLSPDLREFFFRKPTQKKFVFTERKQSAQH